MILYPYPEKICTKPFEVESSDETRYGLPPNVKFCRSCVISNQRPSSTIEFKNDGKSDKKVISFDNFGVCDACRAKELKQQIDWKQREKELRSLCDRYRRNEGRYDCLVPGSGG